MKYLILLLFVLCSCFATAQTYHKYRIYDKEEGLKGAQLINGVDSQELILDDGDNYVLEGRAYKVMTSFFYTFSGLNCFLYILEHDPELQQILDFIGL